MPVQAVKTVFLNFSEKIGGDGEHDLQKEKPDKSQQPSGNHSEYQKPWNQQNEEYDSNSEGFNPVGPHIICCQTESQAGNDQQDDNQDCSFHRARIL